jgi:hypothetical protein
MMRDFIHRENGRIIQGQGKDEHPWFPIIPWYVKPTVEERNPTRKEIVIVKVEAKFIISIKHPSICNLFLHIAPIPQNSQNMQESCHFQHRHRHFIVSIAQTDQLGNCSSSDGIDVVN